MADAPERPSRAGENKAVAGAAQFPERPLDVDVSSSAGPYPRPRPPRSGLRKIWLATAGAAIILGLTWVLSSSDEETALPPPPAPPASTPAGATPPAGSIAGQTERTLDFAPVLDLPEENPQPPVSSVPAVKPPAKAAATAKPAVVKPTPATPSAKPVENQAQTSAPAEPADKPAEESAKPADKPAEAADQPVVASAADKPASGTSEISDKWVVNIYSTQDATESLRFLSTLLGQEVGGRVYASEAVLEGRLQHRIRVGFFDTKEEAEAVGLKIKERFQLYATPWAVRPIKEEENKYGGGR